MIKIYEYKNIFSYLFHYSLLLELLKCEKCIYLLHKLNFLTNTVKFLTIYTMNPPDSASDDESEQSELTELHTDDMDNDK